MLKNQSGLGMPELLLSTVILLLGFAGVSSIYSYIGGQNRNLEVKRSVMSVNEALRNGILDSLKTYWLNGLGATATCDTTGPVLAFNSFNNTEFRVHVMDATASNPDSLDTFLPDTNSDGTTNELKSEIIALLDADDNLAFSRCSDSAFLQAHAAQYPNIVASTKNQLLCRCATAATPYGTYHDVPLIFQDYNLLYACIAVAPSTVTTATQTQDLLKQGRVIIEATFGVLNIADGSNYTCEGSRTADADKRVYKMDYVLNWEGPGEKGKTGLFQFPGTLVKP